MVSQVTLIKRFTSDNINMSRWDHLILHQLEFLEVGIEEFEKEDWTSNEACDRLNTTHFENLKSLILSAPPDCRLHLMKIGFNMNQKLGLAVIHAFWVLKLDPCPRMNVREPRENFQPPMTENTLIMFPTGKAALYTAVSGRTKWCIFTPGPGASGVRHCHSEII